MKKIALFLIFLSSFVLSNCPDTIVYIGKSAIHSGVLFAEGATLYNHGIYAVRDYKVSAYESGANSISNKIAIWEQCKSFPIDDKITFAIGSDFNPVLVHEGYKLYDLNMVLTYYLYLPTPPESEDNETCPYNGIQLLVGENVVCSDCQGSDPTTSNDCACSAIGSQSPSGGAVLGPMCWAVKIDDKTCATECLTNCANGESVSYITNVHSCSNDNETNGSINPNDNTTNPDDNDTTPIYPDDNSTSPNDNNTTPTNPNDNTTNPDSNGTGSPGGAPGGSPGGSPGGDPGGNPNGDPGGLPGGDPNGNTTGNTTNNNETNGTCDGAFGEFNCLDSGKIKTVSDEYFFDVLKGHYDDVMSQYEDLKSLYDGGFEYHAPNINYVPSSVVVFGKQITFDTCTPVGRISPIFRFVVTCLGYILALRIIFWRL